MELGGKDWIGDGGKVNCIEVGEVPCTDQNWETDQMSFLTYT